MLCLQTSIMEDAPDKGQTDHTTTGMEDYTQQEKLCHAMNSIEDEDEEILGETITSRDVVRPTLLVMVERQEKTPGHLFTSNMKDKKSQEMIEIPDEVATSIDGKQDEILDQMISNMEEKKQEEIPDQPTTSVDDKQNEILGQTVSNMEEEKQEEILDQAAASVDDNQEELLNQAAASVDDNQEEILNQAAARVDDNQEELLNQAATSVDDNQEEIVDQLECLHVSKPSTDVKIGFKALYADLEKLGYILDDIVDKHAVPVEDIEVIARLKEDISCTYTSCGTNVRKVLTALSIAQEKNHPQLNKYFYTAADKCLAWWKYYVSGFNGVLQQLRRTRTSSGTKKEYRSVDFQKDMLVDDPEAPDESAIYKHSTELVSRNFHK